MKYKLKRPLPRAEVGTIWDVLLYGKEILMKEDNNDLQEIFPSATFSDWFEEVDERWKPEHGDTYWLMEGAEDDISDWTWRDGEQYPEKMWDMGYVFRTRELAEQAAEQIKALLKEFHKNNP